LVQRENDEPLMQSLQGRFGAMTLRQAIDAKVRILPGRKVKTFGGWCRRDRVMLDGHEIGKIQVRKGTSGTEITTIAGDSFLAGYQVDWLLDQRPCELLRAVG
jgi:hypothetical protein